VAIGSMPADDRVWWVRSRTSAGTLITVGGDLDLRCAGAFAAALAAVAHDGSGVVIDMADVDFIDSAALDAIRRAERLFAILGLAFGVRSPSPVARRTLGLFRLDALIEQAEPAPPEMLAAPRPSQGGLVARPLFWRRRRAGGG